MFANLFPLLRDAAAVTALIGTAPVRFYAHGNAPQSIPVSDAYATHRTISQDPQNHLEALAPADVARVQVSGWAGSGSAAKALATAMRDAIEPHHHILDVRDMGRDFETQRFRIDLDVEVWIHRESASSSTS